MIDSKKLIAMVEKYEKLIYDTADYICTPGDGIPRVEHFRLHGKTL